MVSEMDPCCCLRNDNFKCTNSLIRCCLKKHKICNEEESGFEFEFLKCITDQLLLEILLRLPSKRACRFKLVCKHWCSLISSSYFISRFINHRRQSEFEDTPKTFTLVFQHEVEAPAPPGCLNYLQRIDAVSNDPVVSKSCKNKPVDLNFLPRFQFDADERDTLMLPPESVPISVKASCHDLLLCSHFATYYVVNLLTRQWIALPPLPRLYHESSPRDLYDGSSPGLLCYHDQNDISNGDGWYRFKVILIPFIYPCFSPENVQDANIHVRPKIYSSQVIIRIFCSESKQWTKVVVDGYPLQRCTTILAHNRMVHWPNGGSLVSLDPFSNDLHLRLSYSVKLPDKLVLDDSLCFAASLGRLRIACRIWEHDPVIYIWELDDSHRGPWLLVHKVVTQRSSLRQFGFCFNVIAFHPYNRDVIFVKRGKSVYLFNMLSDKLEKYCMLKLDKGHECGMYVDIVPPLLHQWFPTPVPSPPPSMDA